MTEHLARLPLPKSFSARGKGLWACLPDPLPPRGGGAGDGGCLLRGRAWRMAEPRMVYLSNNRLPTEKAHGLQESCRCARPGRAGYAVTLSHRALQHARDARRPLVVGSLRRAAQLAFTRLLSDCSLVPALRGVAFLTQTLTYLLANAGCCPSSALTLLYTRDLFIARRGPAAPRTPIESTRCTRCTIRVRAAAARVLVRGRTWWPHRIWPGACANWARARPGGPRRHPRGALRRPAQP